MPEDRRIIAVYVPVRDPASAKEDSAFGIFRNIFIDIGDETILENDLAPILQNC